MNKNYENAAKEAIKSIDNNIILLNRLKLDLEGTDSKSVVTAIIASWCLNTYCNEKWIDDICSKVDEMNKISNMEWEKHLIKFGVINEIMS